MNFTDTLKPGLNAETTAIVTKKNTASSYGSGYLDVFSTPAMIALMEEASYMTVDAILPSGHTTVGTEVNIKHLAATPIGMKVSARAELLNIDGRALLFKVEAFDEKAKIGEGTHSRFIVEVEKFMAKTEGKK